MLFSITKLLVYFLMVLIKNLSYSFWVTPLYETFFISSQAVPNKIFNMLIKMNYFIY